MNPIKLSKNTSTQTMVDNVDLAAWAKHQQQFIYFNKLAIESPFVRSSLNRCIDIIFGYKSCGEKVRKVKNLYHPFCYILYNSYYRIPLTLDSYHKNRIIKTFDEKIITNNLNQINDTPI